MTVARDYALEREQFGVPIGSFQAVKHMLADMFVRTGLARSATYAAAAVYDDPGIGTPARAAAIAKLLAGEAALANARAAVQVLGGMGFTWDMPPNYLLKRAWVLEHSFGTSDAHALALGSSIEEHRVAGDQRHGLRDDPYEVDDRIATITFNRPDQLNAVSPADDPRAAARVRGGRGRRRGVDDRRHRRRAARSAPAPTSTEIPDDGRVVYDEPYLSTLRAVGGAAGGDAAVPHDDQADPHRGERAVLRRRARPRHDRRHRRSRRIGPSSSTRT